MDNEASIVLKRYLTTNEVECQLVPLHSQRYNTVKRAKRTFKEHVMYGRATIDPDFPMHLWDRLLHQAVLTLSVWCTSRLSHQMSAAELLCGPFDYTNTPISPPCNIIIAHEKQTSDALGHAMGKTGIHGDHQWSFTAVTSYVSLEQPLSASRALWKVSLAKLPLHPCIH
jgi:hypothetical protein